MRGKEKQSNSVAFAHLPDIELGGGANPKHHPNFDAVCGDIMCDLTQGIPLQDNTVKQIYSRDFFEHLTFNEGLELLGECRRVLGDRGWIEFIIPNVAFALMSASVWNKHLCNVLFGTRKGYFEWHKAWYSPDLMRYILYKEGWKDIVIKDCKLDSQWYLEPKFIVRAGI